MDPHETHPDVTLTLSEHLPDGGMIVQSWTICGCGLPKLRAQLGQPHNQSISNADAVMDLAKSSLNHPGITHMLENDPSELGL